MKKFFVFLFALVISLNATKIKDITNVVGVRDNELIGYGLVVGLSGSGDSSSSEFTIQSISNMLASMDVKVNPDDIKSKNTAAVMITAKLPAFARSGDKLDIVVSSLGDAKSLKGGTLLLSALKGADGNIYALAQGNLSGMNTKHSTSLTLLGGGIVERELEYNFANQDCFTLSLKNASFKTSSLIEMTINSRFGEDTAVADDSKNIRLNKPANMSATTFLAGILDMDLDGYKMEDKVIIDEKTGTIVTGVDIAVEPVLISHGGITIKVEPEGSMELVEGETDLKDGAVLDNNNNILRINSDKITLANISRILTKLGASPSDIIEIIQNLKRAGAITAKVEVI